MERKKLSRIGPGLGSRARIWIRVLNKVSGAITGEELELLRRLAKGETWERFVPPEWIDIYGAQSDESPNLPIDEREVVRIDKDVPRTFGLFVRNGRLLRMNFPGNMSSYYTALKDVLIAVSRDRGYCQGINFIAASLLLHTADQRQSIILLSFLLKHRRLEILFDPRYSALLDYMKIFEKRLRRHCPRVYRHFKKYDFTTVSYAIEWFTTCFIVTCPGELSLCVLDLLVAGFDDIMLRVGLGLFKVMEPTLLKMDFEKLHQETKQCIAAVDPHLVMAEALKIPQAHKISVLEGMSLKIDALAPDSNGNLKYSSSGSIRLSEPAAGISRNRKVLAISDSGTDDDQRPEEEECSADFEEMRVVRPNKHRSHLSRMTKGLSKRWRSLRGVKKAPSTPISPKPATSPKPVAANNTTPANHTAVVSNPHPVQPAPSPAVRKPAEVITNWWNETWKTTLGLGAVNAQKPPALHNPTAAAAAASASATGGTAAAAPAPTTKVLKAVPVEPFSPPGSAASVSPHPTASTVSTRPSNGSLTLRAQSHSPVSQLPPPPKRGMLCVQCDYDGDREDISDRKKSPMAGSGKDATLTAAGSSLAEEKPRGSDDFGDGAYVDQGGEVLEAMGAALVLANHRIAEALDTLDDNWFRFRGKRVPESNLKVRAMHKTRPQDGWRLLEKCIQDNSSA